MANRAMLKEDATGDTAQTQAVDVERLHQAHPKIRAADWRSPLIHRLLRKAVYKDGTASVTSSFRSHEQKVREVRLTLRWSGLKDDFEACINTYQAPVLTEFATLGLACILLEQFTDLRITEVTRRGERVDYWIGNASKRKLFVLEVGGQQDGTIDALAVAKTSQLQENPWGSSGYICVAVYDGARARLWFCHHETIV